MIATNSDLLNILCLYWLKTNNRYNDKILITRIEEYFQISLNKQAKNIFTLDYIRYYINVINNVELRADVLDMIDTHFPGITHESLMKSIKEVNDIMQYLDAQDTRSIDEWFQSLLVDYYPKYLISCFINPEKIHNFEEFKNALKANIELSDTHYTIDDLNEEQLHRLYIKYLKNILVYDCYGD